MVILGHSIPLNDKEQVVEQLRRTCCTPVLALRRPNEEPLTSAQYNLDSFGPSELIAMVEEIVRAASTRHLETAKSVGVPKPLKGRTCGRI